MEHNYELLMQQVWMQLNGPLNSCSLVHPDTHCVQEIIIKCLTVAKKSSRMYVGLYLLVFLTQIKKISRQRKFGRTLTKFSKDFICSLAFMSWLVGGMKMALCTLNATQFPIDYKSTAILSLFGSVSLFFNDNHKKAEITYFVLVRACRSAYIILKKKFKFPFSRQRQFCFIAIFMLISYLYFECGQDMKNRKLLKNLWGEV